MPGSLFEKIEKRKLRLLGLILLLCPIPIAAQTEAAKDYSDTLKHAVIVGDKLSMVVHGDTTVYDASCFTTLKGASLKDLLQALPGVTVKDDAIFANGERVEMVLVNGKPLFLKDVKSALNMLYAAEVKDVKLYDQYDPLDYMVRDSLDRKGRVVDVVTKKKIDSITDAFANIALGYRQAGNVSGSIKSYTLDKPRLGLEMGYDRNTHSMAPPCDNVYAISTVDIANRTRKLNIQQRLDFKYDLFRSSSGSESQYVGAMQGWTDASESQSRDATASLNELFNLAKTFGNKRDKLEWHIQLDWQRANSGSSTYRTTSGNAVKSMVDLRSETLDNSYGISSNVSWTHKFKKTGRILKSVLSASADGGTGYGSRIDTTALSSSPMHIELNSTKWHAGSGLNVNYAEPLSKTSSIRASYAAAVSANDASQSSYDCLNSTTDGINTYDYRSVSAKNDVALGYSYKTRYVELHLGGKFVDEFRNVREQCPSNVTRVHNYWSLTPDVTMSYRKGKVRVKAALSGYMTIPTVWQTRDYLDNSTALNLTCGNPSLRQSTAYNLSLSQNYTVTRLQTVFSVNMGVKLTRNYITQDVSLLQTETYLPEYDYTSPAGTRVVRPVNASGYVSAFTDLSADIKSTPLKSTFFPLLTVNYSRTPFSNDGVESFNAMVDASCGLGYRSSFSSKYSLTITSKVGYSRYYRTSSLLYDSVVGDVVATFKANPVGGLWIKPMVVYNGRKTFNGLSPYNNCGLSASISYKFGKNDRMEVGVTGDDLLNDNRYENLVSSDVMVTRSWNNTLGRTVLLFFHWRLR